VWQNNQNKTTTIHGSNNSANTKTQQHPSFIVNFSSFESLCAHASRRSNQQERGEEKENKIKKKEKQSHPMVLNVTN